MGRRGEGPHTGTATSCYQEITGRNDVYRGRKSGRQGYKEQVSQRALSTGNGRENTVSCRLWPADPRTQAEGLACAHKGSERRGCSVKWEKTREEQTQ